MLIAHQKLSVWLTIQIKFPTGKSGRE